MTRNQHTEQSVKSPNYHWKDRTIYGIPFDVFQVPDNLLDSDDILRVTEKNKYMFMDY